MGQKGVKEEFQNKIGRMLQSAAYLNYCEEVHGYRQCLCNMMDQEQLDFLYHSMSVTEQDTILDLGCGCGSLLYTLTREKGCAGIGIDLLDELMIDSNITSKFDHHITYIQSDFEHIEDMHLSPTITLAIDSMYFVKDVEKILRYLYSIPNNRVYLFYSQYLMDANVKDKSILQGDHTLIGEILHRNQIPFEMVNYSENEKMLYEKSLAALEKYKKDFLREGNQDLWEEKWNEQILGKELYDRENASRYRYSVTTC